MNYQHIDKDFKNLTKHTEKLIDQYNKSCTSIKSQELAIAKVKAELEQLVNGEKTPTSIKNLETSLKSAEKEVANLQKQYNQTTNEIARKQIDLEFAQGMGNFKEVSSIRKEQESLNLKSIELATELEDARDKADKLKASLEELKLNPANVTEIQQLNSKLDTMETKLSQTKDKANDLKSTIENSIKKDQTEPLRTGLKETKNTLNDINKIAKNSSKAIGKSSLNVVSKQIKDIGNKLDKFKNKMMGLIGTAIVFNLLRNGLNQFRDNLISLLKTNDVFNSNLAQIKGNLMTAFAPIYNAILPAINSLMVALNQVTATFANFITSIFGTNLKDATKDAEKLSSALNETAKSGDNASGSLSKIDKLDVIGNESKSGSGTQNNIDYSGVTNANGVLLDTLNRLKELISNDDWGGLARYISQGFVNAFSRLTEKIKGINWSELGTNISTFLENIDWSGILVGLVSIFGETVLGFQKLLFNIDWGKVLLNFSTGLKDAIFKVNDYITQIRWSDLGRKLSDAIVSIDWGGIASGIVTNIWNVFKGMLDLLLNIDWGAVGKKLSDSLHQLSITIRELFTNTNWGELGRKIVDAIWNFITNINWGQLGIDILNGIALGIQGTIDFVIGVFQEIFNKILEFFGIHSPSTKFIDVGINIMKGLFEGIQGMIESVLKLFGDIFNGICNIFGSIGTWFNDNVFEPIKNVFTNIWDTLTSGASKAWEGIKNVFSTVANFFGSIFSTAWQKVKEVFSTGGKIFDGIKDGIVNAFKTVVNAIIRGINKVVAIPFNGINSALKKIRDIEFLGIAPFKKVVKTFSVPQIPELAKGAVIPPRQKFAAILGDQRHGTNIEAPLETIKQANREVLNEFFDKLGALTTQVREIVLKNFTIVAQFGDRSFRQVVYEAIRLTEQELGKPLFVN